MDHEILSGWKVDDDTCSESGLGITRFVSGVVLDLIICQGTAGRKTNQGLLRIGGVHKKDERHENDDCLFHNIFFWSSLYLLVSLFGMGAVLFEDFPVSPLF